MKKTNNTVFYLLLLFFGLLNTSTQAAQKETLLWKISGKDLSTPSYLYGTIHLKDSTLFNFPDSLYSAFERSQTYVMEIIPTPENMQVVVSAMQLPKGQTIQDKFSKNTYDKIKKELKEQLDLDIELFKNLQPWALETYIFQQLTPQERAEAMDLYFFNLAEKNGKTTTSLETPLEQLALLQETPLEQTIENLSDLEKQKDEYKILKKLYLEANPDKIFKETRKHSTQDFTKKMLLNRNQIMADRLVPIIKKQSAFIAVGAAHLGGSKGLIKLLQKKGYEITPILCPSRSQAPPLKPKMNVTKYTREDLGFAIDFPSAPSESEQKIPSAVGELTMKIFMVEGSDLKKPLLHFIAVTDYPNGAIHSDSLSQVKTFFDNSLTSMTNNLKGEISNKRTFSFEGYPALEAAVSIQNNAFLDYFWEILVDNRLYMIQIIIPKKEELLPHVKQFQESFKLLPKKE